jgi:hypothetical protein
MIKRKWKINCWGRGELWMECRWGDWEGIWSNDDSGIIFLTLRYLKEVGSALLNPISFSRKSRFSTWNVEMNSDQTIGIALNCEIWW